MKIRKSSEFIGTIKSTATISWHIWINCYHSESSTLALFMQTQLFHVIQKYLLLVFLLYLAQHVQICSLSKFWTVFIKLSKWFGRNWFLVEKKVLLYFRDRLAIIKLCLVQYLVFGSWRIFLVCFLTIKT